MSAMEQKDIREERLGTPEVLYILQRLDAMDEKYDKKNEEVNRKLEAVRLELKQDIMSVRDELRDEIKDVKKEITTMFWRIVGIIIAIQGATIAILQFLK